MAAIKPEICRDVISERIIDFHKFSTVVLPYYQESYDTETEFHVNLTEKFENCH